MRVPSPFVRSSNRRDVDGLPLIPLDLPFDRSKRRYLYLDDFTLAPVRRRRWVLLFALAMTIPFVFFIYDHRELVEDDLTARTYIADYARIFGYCFVPMLVSHWRPVSGGVPNGSTRMQGNDLCNRYTHVALILYYVMLLSSLARSLQAAKGPFDLYDFFILLFILAPPLINDWFLRHGPNDGVSKAYYFFPEALIRFQDSWVEFSALRMLGLLIAMMCFLVFRPLADTGFGREFTFALSDLPRMVGRWVRCGVVRALTYISLLFWFHFVLQNFFLSFFWSSSFIPLSSKNSRLLSKATCIPTPTSPQQRHSQTNTFRSWLALR